jgi:hypothetical protein
MNRTVMLGVAAFAAVTFAIGVPAVWSPADGGQRAATREHAQKQSERKPPANQAPTAQPPATAATQAPADRAVPRDPQGSPQGQPRAVPREQPRDQGRPETHGHFGPYWPPFYPVPYVPWYYPYGYYPPYWYPYPFESYGSVRLEIDQKTANVFADGFYVGVVDDFDGVFQHLNLKVGAHRLEIAAVGYETLTLDVNIAAGKTITYKQSMVQTAPILP